MEKRIDLKLLKAVFADNPALTGAEYYFLEEGDVNSPCGRLVCFGAYPEDSGSTGFIIPSPLITPVFRRLIWTFSDDSLLSGTGGGLFRSLKPLIYCLKNMTGDSRDDHSRSPEDILGFSIFEKGRPSGVCIIRYKKEKGAESVFPAAEKILSAYTAGQEKVWPRFSELTPFNLKNEWTDPEKNCLPLNMAEVRNALGDSESVFFSKVMPGFLKRLPSQLEEMENCIGEKDNKRLRKLNHRIKGAAASLFINRVGSAGTRLEDIIDAGKNGEIPEAFSELKRETEILESFCKTVMDNLNE